MLDNEAAYLMGLLGFVLMTVGVMIVSAHVAQYLVDTLGTFTVGLLVFLAGALIMSIGYYIHEWG